MALVLTFVCGLFFLIGIVIYKFSKNKNFLNLISISCACVVLFGLIIFDLIPELIEINEWWLILFVMLGLALLMILDLFVPNHSHHHIDNDENTKEHQDHIVHIGTITIIALLLHNMVEGMALYGMGTNNLKSGVLMCIGIGLHNLPFGFQIASFNEKKHNKVLLILLVLSGFIGGLIVYFFGSISEIILGIIIAVTLGMVLHIFLFELLKEVINNRKKKETIYGIIIGVIILVLICFV